MCKLLCNQESDVHVFVVMFISKQRVSKVQTDRMEGWETEVPCRTLTFGFVASKQQRQALKNPGPNALFSKPCCLSADEDFISRKPKQQSGHRPKQRFRRSSMMWLNIEKEWLREDNWETLPSNQIPRQRTS